MKKAKKNSDSSSHLNSHHTKVGFLCYDSKENPMTTRPGHFEIPLQLTNPFFKVRVLKTPPTPLYHILSLTYFNKSPLFTTNASITAMAAYKRFSASSKTMEFSL